MTYEFLPNPPSTIAKEGVARLVADHEVAGRLISEVR